MPVCETCRWSASAGGPTAGWWTPRRRPCACPTVGGVKERDPGPAYQPMTLARLSVLLVGADESRRWRLVAEFLEEFRWEPPDARQALLVEEPPGVGDERWDVFLPRSPSTWQRVTAVELLRGSNRDRCDGCGSRSTPARPGSMRWSTRLRRSGGSAIAWPVPVSYSRKNAVVAFWPTSGLRSRTSPRAGLMRPATGRRGRGCCRAPPPPPTRRRRRCLAGPYRTRGGTSPRSRRSRGATAPR